MHLSLFLNNIRKKLVLKRSKKFKIVVLLVALCVTFLILATIIFQATKNTKTENKVNIITNKKDKFVDLKTVKRNEVDLWINDSGPYDRDFYFHKNEKINIRLTITKETQESLVPLIDDLIKRNIVTFQVEGANEINVLKASGGNYGKSEYSGEDGKVKHGQSAYLTTSYIPKNAGKDTIKLAIKGTDITFESHLFILDPSYFTIPINLALEDISFTTENFLSVKSQKKNQPDPAPRSDAWWNIDYPGSINYEFTSKGQKFDNAYLVVYTIADGALQKYNANDPFNNFIFLKNLQELTKVIAAKPTLPNESSGIVAFPPINAEPGPRSKINFVDFQNGTGVRYLIPGWFQAVEEADFPTYTYQGITSDGKYQILFRYSKLYSPRLDNYVKINKNNFDYNNGQDKYIRVSFDEVAKEEKFSPSIEELDQFVRSIKVGK